MSYIIKGRNPESVFHFFEDICEIPHGSGNEKGIADYIEAFASKRGLYCYRDAIHNVFVKMPATEGRENDPAVLLQAHTDMVCEKNEDTEHDFLKDPLKLYIDGKYLRADGTTLGADDGIGVAVMLAVLDGAVASHPAIECLFTVSEETGMGGISEFDFSVISAKKVINIDSPEIDLVVGGCAGGVRSNFILTGIREEYDGRVIDIAVKGLAGGHSGENISEGRANANKLMGRVLLALGETDYRIVSITGGGKANAIPRECKVTLKVKDTEKLIGLLKDLEKEIAFELSSLDKDFRITYSVKECEALAFDKDTTEKIATFIGSVANGVLEMSKKIQGFVEYSRNLGVINTVEDRIICTFFARSGIDAQLKSSDRELEALAKVYGADVEYIEWYSGWAYKEDSPLRESYAAAYRNVFGKEIKSIQIHAGLECGYISTMIDGSDIISVGPNVYGLHSPDECMDLDSVENFFKIIEELLSK